MRIAIGEIDLAAYGRNAEAISVKGDAADDALQNPLVLLLVQRSEPKAVHGGDRPRAHRKDVTQNAADAGGCALERLNKRRMIMGFDLVMRPLTRRRYR